MHKVSDNISKTYIKELINKKDPIILDIGCYDCMDAMELACEYTEDGDRCEIHAFEADSRSIDLILYGVKSGLSFPEITLYSTAVGAVDGEIGFYPSDSDTRRHHSFQNNWSASGSIKKPKGHLESFPDVYFKDPIMVPCTALDTWYLSNISPKIIDFMWVDVNGAEKDVIDGGKFTIVNNTRFLYIEFFQKELYENCLDLDEIKRILPMFELLGIYNFEGSFGNALFKNKNL